MKKFFFSLIVMIFTLTACSFPGLDDVQNLVFPSTEKVPTEVVRSDTQPVKESGTLSESESTSQPVLLFGIGMHVEPFGQTAQGYAGSGKGESDYNDPVFFAHHVELISTVTDMVAAHNGLMTIQVQSPFTEQMILSGETILKDLASLGFEIALHFHEDAHLGKQSSSLPVTRWCETMKQEINLVKAASGVSEVNYWSGGNLYPQIFQAAACAGLSVNSDWKNPQTQTTDLSMQGIEPWRPSGGTDGSDFAKISTHNPNGAVVYLPEGLFDREDIMAIKQSPTAGGDDAYFAFLEKSLMDSLAAAKVDRVNVFHFTLHPNEFHGNPAEPFAVIERFLTEVIDPLVASGQVQWATFSQMETAFETWEAANPGVDPRN